MAALQTVNLTIDEIEAVRLADHQGLYHQDAAEKMNVSRQTFGRILDGAHKKIADALVNGKALSIEGGNFSLNRPGPAGKAFGQGIPGPAPGRGFGRGRGMGKGRGKRFRGGKGKSV